MTHRDFFPTRIWQTTNTNVEEILRTVEDAYNKNPAGRNISNIGGWQSDNLKIDTSFYIEYFLKYIVLDLGIVSPSCVTIPAIWANNNKLGGFNMPHDHIEHGNIISFVHYLKLPNNASTINFRSDRPSLKFWNAPRSSFTELNSQDVVFDVAAGDVIFFPAWLEHYTTPNNSSLDRISIAGNINIEYEKSTRL
jgi:uncharacterized protein (TIGR02466 family)